MLHSFILKPVIVELVLRSTGRLYFRAVAVILKIQTILPINLSVAKTRCCYSSLSPSLALLSISLSSLWVCWRKMEIY